MTITLPVSGFKNNLFIFWVSEQKSVASGPGLPHIGFDDDPLPRLKKILEYSYLKTLKY